jgi:hypothetical protein
MPETLKNVPDADAIAIVNLTRLRQAQADLASSTGSLRSVCAKAEMQGINLPAAKRALRIVKSDNMEEEIAEIQATLKYCQLLGKPATKDQLDLFAYDNGLAPLDEKAANDGRRAGLSDEPESTNPHDLNTKAGQAWLAAFRQGRAERDIVLQMAAEEEEGDADDEETDDTADSVGEDDNRDLRPRFQQNGGAA